MAQKIESLADEAVEQSLRELGFREFTEAESRARSLLPLVFGWSKTRWLISSVIVFWLFFETSLAVAAALAWLMLIIEGHGIFIADVWFRVFKPDLGHR